MIELTDEDLMQKVQSGRLEYMETLYDRYQRPLFNYFLKCTFSKHDSEDLTQMVFMKVIHYGKSYDSQRGFRLWLFRIARNLLMDHYQKLRVDRERFYQVEILPDLPDAQLSKTQMEQEELLYKSLEKLPLDKREPLVLSKFEKMKYEDLAILRNTTVAAIKVQVHRAIALLRQLYFENEND